MQATKKHLTNISYKNEISFKYMLLKLFLKYEISIQRWNFNSCFEKWNKFYNLNGQTAVAIPIKPSIINYSCVL